jgi:predicted nicotinamide N-methyase
VPDVEHYIAVVASTQLLPVPFVPEVVLYAAENAYEVWEITRLVGNGDSDAGESGARDIAGESGAADIVGDSGDADTPVPYWSFPWAGGQALARHLIDDPGLVRGRRVLDLAAGSGLVAIAAMKAGAASAVANDVDPFAAAAQALNARANQTRLEILQGDLLDETPTADEIDVVVAGDVCYERGLAERLEGYLRRAKRNGVDVLLADPGRTYLPRERLEQVAVYDVPTSLAIEGVERKPTTIWTPTADL